MPTQSRAMVETKFKTSNLRKEPLITNRSKSMKQIILYPFKKYLKLLPDNIY